MKGYLLFIIPIFALAALAACAAADEQTNTTELESGDFIGVEIKCDVMSMAIEYDVKVNEGPPIDVYFMDSSGYDSICAGNDFTSFKKGDTKDSLAAHKEWYWSKKGTFYVVIGNKKSTNLTANITYTVKWTDSSSSAAFGVVFLFIVIPILILVTIVLLVRRRRRRAKGATVPIAQTAAPAQPTQPGQFPPPAGGTPPPPTG
jgi:hypothetical protein